MPAKSKKQERRHKYYLDNKESISNKRRQYYLDHKDDLNRKRREHYQSHTAEAREWYIKYYEENRQKIADRQRTLKGKYTKYRTSAKSRGLMFALSVEEFSEFWQKPCFYCGSSIETIGIDRVDSELGYFIGNVVSCCFVCNYAKLDRTQEEFIDHCKRVANNFKEE